MCRKTVLRRLIGKWGVMSIDYQAAPSVVAAAEAVAKGEFDDADTTPTIDIGIEEEAADTMIVNDGRTVDPETGELFNA